MWMIHSLLNILFPTRCLGCKKDASALCNRCMQLARKALSTPHPYIISVFDFQDPLIKQAIHAIKYHHRKDIIPPLAYKLAEELRALPTIQTYTLVPIPMTRTRKFLRGYNQAELIATEISKLLSLPLNTKILTRSKNTLRQVKTKTREARLTNQAGSFHIDENVSGKNILLIDDVTTTGATVDEARKIFLKHGVSHVRAGTLAH